MYYTKPSVGNLTNAIAAIQQQQSSDPTLKTPDVFMECTSPGCYSCTFNAYEADE